MVVDLYGIIANCISCKEELLLSVALVAILSSGTKQFVQFWQRAFWRTKLISEIILIFYQRFWSSRLKNLYFYFSPDRNFVK